MVLTRILVDGPWPLTLRIACHARRTQLAPINESCIARVGGPASRPCNNATPRAEMVVGYDPSSTAVRRGMPFLSLALFLNNPVFFPRCGRPFFLQRVEYGNGFGNRNNALLKRVSYIALRGFLLTRFRCSDWKLRPGRALADDFPRGQYQQLLITSFVSKRKHMVGGRRIANFGTKSSFLQGRAWASAAQNGVSTTASTPLGKRRCTSFQLLQARVGLRADPRLGRGDPVSVNESEARTPHTDARPEAVCYLCSTRVVG